MKAANWLTHLDLEWDSPVWGHWLAALSDGYRLIRYDERGCGLSDRDEVRITFDAWVADLADVVDAAVVDGPFTLLGISQGGAVAVAYAAQHPERVEALVLVGAYARGRMVRAATADEREDAALDINLAKVAWRRGEDAFFDVFASQFLPDATANAAGRVQRPPARDDIGHQRGTLPRGIRGDRHRRCTPAGALPHDRVPRPR